MRTNQQDEAQRKLMSKFGPDGKRKTGYQINPASNHIDLKEVAQQSNVNIMSRMSTLEKQFNKIPPHLIGVKEPPLSEKDIYDQENKLMESFTNQRLVTPNTRRLMKKKDASVMLKEEISESSLRLKAAKFGTKTS